MEKYIFVRNFTRDDHNAKAKDELRHEDGKYHIWSKSFGYINLPNPIEKIDEGLKIHLLPIDADLFKNAFQSFAYTNWLKEKAADIDDEGNEALPGLVKSPETLIMYLMELGLSSNTLLKYIYGSDNRYMEYRYLVQEFGKML